MHRHSGRRSICNRSGWHFAAPRLPALICLCVFGLNLFAASGSARASSASSFALADNIRVSEVGLRTGRAAFREKTPDSCLAIASRLPGVSLAECHGSKLADTGARSRDGLPVLARRIDASSRKNDKPPVRILLIGGIHGDELTSSAIVFRWLRLMDQAPAGRFQWSIVPLLNPDGMLTRKSSRTNAAGVDLNRNFPTPGWQKEAPLYWAKATRKDPRRYPGPSPLSEPETRWLNQEIARFQPQVVVSVHAPFGVLDLDGPARPPTRFGRLLFNRVGVYPGSLGNYIGRYGGIPVVTIELPNATTMPSEFEVQRIWQDMLGWIAHSVEPGVSATNQTRALDL
jgi:protein MpaA